MSRLLYAERTALSVKDLKDQPESKYVAVLHDLLGQKSYIACDGIVINDHVITLTRYEEGEKLARFEAGKAVTPQARQIPVCTFPTRSGWAMLLRDRFIAMTGEEWEAHQVEDAKNFKAIKKAAVDNADIVEAIALPSGQVVAIPASPEAREQYEKAMKSKEAPETRTGYDDSRLYA